ncbi:MAG TPA: alpha-amylase family glycosyl hydrolase [Mucilaginibacter sp.]|jgi:maltose alpha-D-glucosyltransferase/alpha-amylase
MKKTILLLAGLLISVFASAQKHADWIKAAVFYQIYPSSFQDSNGNGIGDLKGIQSRLDYVQSLGINTIWLNPVFKSGFKDGGYDVIDFYQVDPRFGTNTELVQLANEIHRRGMHIVLDLVAGHSSNQSAWFKQSMEADKNQQYSDYYIWANEKPKDLPAQEASHWVEANAPRAKYYIKNYYDIQPALNYGYANPNPNHPWEQSVDAPGPRAVRRELQNIITFWLEKGIDGFRVDLASSLVKNDPDKKATITLWKDLSGWFHEKFPQGVLIAEWFNPKQSIAAGFDIDFLRPGKLTSAYQRGQKTADKIYFDKAGEGSVFDWETYFKDQYEGTLNKGYVSLPTGNHDSPRIASEDRKDDKELKVMLTFFLTQPGVPFIYYGDEIGMKYIPNSPDVEGSRNRSGTRTPMQWDASENAGFSTATKDKLYIPQDPDPNRPTVAKQEKDPHSQLNYVRELLKLRASSAALGNDGEWELLSDVNQPYPMIYMRRHGNEKYIIAINPSAKDVEAKITAQDAKRGIYTTGTTKSCSYKTDKNGDVIKMPAISAAIFKLE